MNDLQRISEHPLKGLNRNRSTRQINFQNDLVKLMQPFQGLAEAEAFSQGRPPVRPTLG